MVIRENRIVLIVHGYNNDQREAADSYNDFYNELNQLLDNYQLQHIWEVYWPGFYPVRPSKIEPLSAASYPAQVLRAPHVAKALADHILALNGIKEVLFIAHSLGCRIVLETLNHLAHAAADGKKIAVPGICLMAAAVPYTSLEAGGTLEPAAKYTNKYYVLFSPADHVLRWLFRPGQFLARGNAWSEAVGRWGKPRTCWKNESYNVVNTQLDHGDYYRGRPALGVGPNRTAPTLARMFGRSLARYLEEYDPYAVNWEGPSSPPLRKHWLVERD
jgi:pimeloyl-ACP methyl ester carboxylesterase